MSPGIIMYDDIIGSILQIRSRQDTLDITLGGLVVGQLTASENQRVQAVEFSGHDMGADKRHIQFVDIFGECKPHTT